MSAKLKEVEKAGGPEQPEPQPIERIAPEHLELLVHAMNKAVQARTTVDGIMQFLSAKYQLNDGDRIATEHGGVIVRVK